MRDDRIEALPNLLTLLRLPLAIAIWFAPGSPAWALSVLAVAGLTDIADGWLARTLRRRQWERDRDPSAWAAGTGRGMWLDPLCDKVFVASVLVAVGVAYGPALWVLALLTVRQVLLAGLWVASRYIEGPWQTSRFTMSARWPGKTTTVLEFVTLALIIVDAPGVEIAAVATAVTGTYAAGYYAWLVKTGDQRRGGRG